jgi:hypothetical protein
MIPMRAVDGVVLLMMGLSLAALRFAEQYGATFGAPCRLGLELAIDRGLGARVVELVVVASLDLDELPRPECYLLAIFHAAQVQFALSNEACVL